MMTATQSTHKKERGPRLGKGADQGLSRFLDAEKRSATACQSEQAMREKNVGQAAAAILFGDSRAVIKVDCAEFQHSHEIAKLSGSPPGYLGHRETHPLITQETLAASYRDDLKLSFLLFDEIEKASDALWQLLLGMLDKATLTLGDNRRVDLSQTVIFLTSNLGSRQIADLVQGGMGFVQSSDKPITGLQKKVERTAVEAARRKFSPEFMNRLDKVVVFHPLILPGWLAARAFSCTPCMFGS